MENGEIKDYQITASSHWNYEHAPYYGRLRSNAGWIPELSDGDPYIIVDLLDITMLCGITIQGYTIGNFVTSFKISLKFGENPFTPYQENGQEKVRE